MAGTYETERAQRVCAACRSRKKSCDKQLPICGSCMKRGFICQYGASPAESDTSSSSPRAPRPPWVIYTAGNPGRPSTLTPTSPSPKRLGPSRALVASRVHEDLDSIIYGKFNEVLALCGLSIDRVIDRFLAGGVHDWLPLISPQLLYEATHELQHRTSPSSPPAADLSILLLAMCLFVVHPTRDDDANHATSPADLYQTVRLLLGNVQAMAAASTRLLQAAILVCAFEYALGRLEAAYVSIGACERTARVLGIDQDPSEAHPSLRDSGDHPGFKLKRIEEWNTWRALVVLEIAVLSELNFSHCRPMTRYPPVEPCLLSGILQIPSLRTALEDDGAISGPTAVSDASVLPPAMAAAGEAKVLKRFERQVQATFFLHRTLQIASVPIEAGAKISQLRELDGQLLSFISATADQDDKSHCGALATALRSLFLLHNSVLSLSPDLAMTTDETRADRMSNNSLAALDTAARIVANAADDHLQTRSVETLPLCCAYNLRAAVEHMRSRRKPPDESLRSCLALEKTLIEHRLGRRESQKG